MGSLWFAFCNRHVYMCLVTVFMSEMFGHLGETLHSIEIEMIMIVHRQCPSSGEWIHLSQDTEGGLL